MKLGIVGFGSLGKYIYNAAKENPEIEVVWVWNRSLEALQELPEELHLNNLDNVGDKAKVDLIVEVAHPSITKNYGAMFLKHANYFVGSPTCFADAQVEEEIRGALVNCPYSVYVPSGALWGAQDIRKMACRGTLHGLSVTMKKHPSSLKLEGELKEKLEQVKKEDKDGEIVLYEGSVRGLCPLAPNNVNTMAAAALAGFNLGFDKVEARLVCDKSLDAHVIDIVASAAPNTNGHSFKVSTERYNPAAVGAVTGSATYESFLSSILLAHSQAPSQIHLC